MIGLIKKNDEYKLQYIKNNDSEGNGEVTEIWSLSLNGVKVTKEAKTIEYKGSTYTYGEYTLQNGSSITTWKRDFQRDGIATSPKTIIFGENLTFTEQFGKYNLYYDERDPSDNFIEIYKDANSTPYKYVLNTEGKSLQNLLEKAFYYFEKISGKVEENPSCSLSLVGNSVNTGEIGTTYSAPSAKISVRSFGSYTYGPSDTGVTITPTIKAIYSDNGSEDTESETIYENSENKYISIRAIKTYKSNKAADNYKFVYTKTTDKFKFTGTWSSERATNCAKNNEGTEPPENEKIFIESKTNQPLGQVIATYTGWARYYVGTYETNLPTSLDSSYENGQAISGGEVVLTIDAENKHKNFFIAVPNTIIANETGIPRVKQYSKFTNDYTEDLSGFEYSGTTISNVYTADSSVIYYLFSYSADTLVDTKFKFTL